MSVPENRAKSIFLHALEIQAPVERQAYVEAACGPDETVRREVEELLRHHGQAGGFLEFPAGGVVVPIAEPAVTEDATGGTAMNHCPSHDQLSRLLAEQMPAEERSDVEAHVETCRICQQTLEQLVANTPGGSGRRTPEVQQPRTRTGGSFLDRLKNSPPLAPGPEDKAGLATTGPVNLIPGTASEQSAVEGYEILGELGRGGMGVVYKARQVRLDRLVALKMILAGGLAGSAERDRFRTEAEAIARVQHPNIVQVHEVGEHDGKPFFSLEFCSGGSLQQKLNGTPQPPLEAAHLVQTLARAVQAAHEKSVIHRDLKPANVLLACDGTPKITDFGLAKKLDDVGQTASGAVMGTPSYMAPEQAGGQNKEVGPAADVYALGAILYELLTGRPPFKATTTMETLLQVLGDDPVPPGQLQSKTPRDLETICLKCLQKEPRKRYPSAQELAEDLRCFLAGEPIQARPVGLWERLGKWTSRRPAAAALLALSVLASVVVVGLMVRQWQLARTAQQHAEARADTESKAKQAAEQAQQVEATLRGQTEEALGQANTQLYLSNVSLAYREWQAGNLGRAEELLNECPLDHRHWEWHYLKRQLNPGLLTLDRQDTVHGVAFSPDGKVLATAERSQVVKLWDSATGKELLALNLKDPPGGPNEVRSVAFSPDGLQVISGSDDGTVRFWEAATGKAGRVLRGHGGPVLSLAFSPDGKRLASASKDRSVKVWDTNTGKEVCTFRGHASMVTGVTFSPDGKSLASVNGFDPSVNLTIEDLTVRLWDATTGQEVRKFGADRPNQQFPPVTTVVFRPDGKHLAAASTDHRVLIWDVQTGQLVHVLAGHTNSVVAVAYSPDGTRLATASQDHCIKVWSGRTYQELFTLRGHPGWLTSLAFSPDSRLASASRDGTVKVWAASAGPEASTLVAANRQSCRALAFSPDGRYVVSASADNTLHLWHLGGGRLGPTFVGHQQAVKSLAFSPDGKRLVSADEGGHVKLWDAATGKELRAFRGALRKAASIVSDTSAVTFTQAGQQLAWAGPDGTVTTWDSSTGGEVNSFQSAPSSDAASQISGKSLRGVAFSHDGRLFACASILGHVKVWEVSTGKRLHDLFVPARGASSTITFSRDGCSLAWAAGGDEGPSELTVWDLTTGRKAITFAGPAGPNLSLGFSPDGKRLASASFDRKVQVWDVATGRELLAFLARPLPGADLAFSPEGHHLGLGSFLGVTLWDATPGTPPEVFTLRKHDHPMSGLAFSPDGQFLASIDLHQLKVISMSTSREVLSLPWALPPDHATFKAAAAGDKTAQFTVALDVAFSPDGQQLAASGGSYTAREVRVLDRTGQLLQTLAGHKGAVRNVAFRPDGQRLASASSDKTVKVWDLTAGQEVFTLAGHTDRVLGVAFSPDGKVLASAGKDKVVKIWEADTGRELFTLSGHSLPVARVVFSPDGQHLVSASGAIEAPSQDGEVKMWDVNTGKEVLTFRGHSGGIFGVAYHPDGRFIASAGNDRTVRIWEADTGREVLMLAGHLAGINRVAFSPNGRFLASCGDDRTVRVWDVTLLDRMPGAPPLTQDVVDLYRKAMEWMLDIQLTEPQRAKWQALFSEDWKMKNPAQRRQDIAGWKKEFAWVGELDQMTDAQRAQLRQKKQEQYLSALRSSKSLDDRFLLAVYEERNKPGLKTGPGPQ